MKRSHVPLLFALVLIISVATVAVFDVEAGASRSITDDIVTVFGDDGGVGAPNQGEPDVGQTGDPGDTQPGMGDLRLAGQQVEGLLSWTSAFWLARLFGIGF